tara:strand:- start:482 stop:1555 length:1074 start_codon:yes stop_codon:yes gene_type:complete
MSYFDPKEEVIDLKLTPYGEHLLSIGKLEPAFYAFFDNDIIYDDKFASVTTENQSDIESRIQEKTPRMHTQTSFSSREKDFTDFVDQEWKVQALYNRKLKTGEVLDETDIALEKIALKRLKPRAEKIKDIYLQPLGKFKSKSQNSPAWNVSFLKTPMDGEESTDYLLISSSAGSNHINIPQLECNLKYKFQRNSAAYNDKVYNDVTTFSGDADPTFHRAASEKSILYKDGSTINLVEDSIIIRVEESNTDFQPDNFDVELFLVDEISNKVGDEEEFLIPLAFQQPSDNIGKVAYSVSNYFNLLVDEEILEEDICPLIKRDTVKHIFETKIFDCEQYAAEGIPQNFYIDVDDTEDVCD